MGCEVLRARVAELEGEIRELTTHDTLPPGGDPMDDPEHAEIIATIERSIDSRFGAMEAHVDDKLDALTAAVRNLADEATKCNALQAQLGILRADLDGLKSRLSIPPDDPRRSSSVPPES